jgi:hypothetical protein
MFSAVTPATDIAANIASSPTHTADAEGRLLKFEARQVRGA